MQNFTLPKILTCTLSKIILNSTKTDFVGNLPHLCVFFKVGVTRTEDKGRFMFAEVEQSLGDHFLAVLCLVVGCVYQRHGHVCKNYHSQFPILTQTLAILIGNQNSKLTAN